MKNKFDPDWLEPAGEHFLNTATGEILMTIVAIALVIWLLTKK